MGATSREQLDENMACLDLTVPDECMKEIISVSRVSSQTLRKRVTQCYGDGCGDDWSKTPNGC